MDKMLKIADKKILIEADFEFEVSDIFCIFICDNNDFDMKYKFDTRLSFSTKIIDCLHSGCAVFAVAWEKHSGLIYLRKKDAALCATNDKEIKSILNDISNDSGIIEEYKNKACECGK